MNYDDKYILSPNPATDFIEIGNIDFENSKGEIQIYNSMGINILSSKTDGLALLRFDISKFPTGIYYIKYGNKIKKFIKI